MDQRVTQFILIYCVSIWIGSPAIAVIVSTTGTMMEELSPHAAAADGVIAIYTEKVAVPFVATQPLQFGSIAPGTLVDSHYVQFDPASPTGIVGAGSVTFDGPVLGVVTATTGLTAALAPDAPGTSDTYFGLASTLGAYPAGAVPSARGLGSPEDDLLVTIGSPVLVVDSLEIPSNAPGNVDGFRVFTATQSAVPTHVAPWVLATVLALSAVAAARALRVS